MVRKSIDCIASIFFAYRGISLSQVGDESAEYHEEFIVWFWMNDAIDEWMIDLKLFR